MDQSTIVSSEQTPGYVPSALERKKVLLMYLFLWIMVTLIKGKVTIYELFHVKQAVGRWMLLVVILLWSLVVVFLPIIKVMAIVPLFAMFGVRVYCIKTAWDGYYNHTGAKTMFSFLEWFGWRALDVFEFTFDVTWWEEKNKSN